MSRRRREDFDLESGFIPASPLRSRTSLAHRGVGYVATAARIAYANRHQFYAKGAYELGKAIFGKTMRVYKDHRANKSMQKKVGGYLWNKAYKFKPGEKRSYRDYNDHLSKMRRRVKRGRFPRRRRRLRRRLFRRSRLRRRGGHGRRLIKRSSPSWFRIVQRDSQPRNCEYSIGFTIRLAHQSDSQGLRGAFFLNFDTKNVVENEAIGAGPDVDDDIWGIPATLNMHIDNPYLIRNLDAIAAFGDANTLPNTNQTFLMDKRYYTWSITNQELAPVKLEIWMVKFRRMVAQTTGNYDGQLDEVSKGFDPNDILARCLQIDQIVPYAANALRRIPTAFNMFQSTMFCRMFKVIKKKTVEMQPGSCFRMHYTSRKPWRITQLDEGYTKTFMNYPRSKFLMLSAVGCPVMNTNAELTANAECLGAIKLSIHHLFRSRTYQMNNTKQTNVAANLEAPAGKPALATQGLVQKPPAVIVLNNL